MLSAIFTVVMVVVYMYTPVGNASGLMILMLLILPETRGRGLAAVEAAAA
jgi:hypothetical protein